MNLYLDDYRKAPPGFKEVRNFKSCIFLLSTMEFDLVSLDYALGEKFTGLDVLKWMAENNKFPKRLNIHSSHSWGRSAMAEYIRLHFPQGYLFTMKSII